MTAQMIELVERTCESSILSTLALATTAEIPDSIKLFVTVDNQIWQCEGDRQLV
jgi:hypothetical protein